MINPDIVGALTFSVNWDRVRLVFQLPGGLGSLVEYAASRFEEAGLVDLHVGSCGWPVFLWHRAVFLVVGRLVEALLLPGLPLIRITPESARINAHRH